MRFPFKQTVLVAKHIAGQKRRGVKKFPLVLMLEPLHACNLSCSGCGRIREYKDVMSEMMSLKNCMQAVEDCNAPVVSICGGEPLLYPQISELVNELLSMKKIVYLCTNGVALEKKLHSFQPHPLFNINVHIDGLEETHDIIVEKKGVFNTAMGGIKLALKKGFTVCTNSTIYKQTDIDEIVELIDKLTKLNINGILLSPAYSYSDVEDQGLFLNKDEIKEKFKILRKKCNNKKIWSTPLYLDFLEGKRSYTCTPWGNVTYNVKGWKAPCYLITDKHYNSYNEFIEKVDWGKYGPGIDKRCEHCRVHCGFEATVALTASQNIKDALRMAWWTLL